MEGIHQLIRELSWNQPENIQQNAVEKLSNLKGKDVILLAIQSNELCSKSCWDNAAIVLGNIGYPNNRAALPYLMELFQDLTWPGVRPIITTLKDINKKILIPFIENASVRAINKHDDCWANGIIYLINELDFTEADFNDLR
ncbi:hypothetical protein [Paenibacillus aestuarii]|uniref:DUF5071 domain-containing protein n=1 Tax=Paenibacillus aestuarii TaxID=516965 RepID=A0ABW0KFX7_9BACL|nr:hypothetical protein [Paenibacillus aestuarii]